MSMSTDRLCTQCAGLGKDHRSVSLSVKKKKLGTHFFSNPKAESKACLIKLIWKMQKSRMKTKETAYH